MNKGAIKKILGDGLVNNYRNVRKEGEKLTSRLRRIFLQNRDFTIISNNCFGGWVYQRYDLPYKTPTAGLFIMPDDYIAMLLDLKYYMNQKLVFISPKQSRYKDFIPSYEKNFGKYPIALLGDKVEIQFLHYKTPEEAAEKWYRRAARINWNNLIVKFNDQNGCEYRHLKAFNEMGYKNKICFTARNYPEFNSVICIKEDIGMPCVRREKEYYNNHVKMTTILNMALR